MAQRGFGSGVSVWGVRWALVIGFVVVLVMPLCAVVPGVVRAIGDGALVSAAFDQRVWVGLGRTIPLVGLIAILSLPGAWLIGGVFAGRGRLAGALGPLLVLPALVPVYLSYSAYGMLIAPDTALGGAVARAADDGARWVPVISKQALAVLGLALWASPIAALPIVASRVRTGGAISERVRLDGVGIGARAVLFARMHARAIGGGFVIAFVLMLGSAIPLHLSQVRTHAVALWSDLALAGPEDWGVVWVRAWPLAAIAVVIGVGVSRRFRAGVAEVDADRARASVGGLIGALAVVALGVLLPALLFVDAVFSGEGGGFDAVREFFAISGEALRTSLMAAGFAGGCVALLCLLVGIALGVRAGAVDRWLVGVLIAGFVAAAVFPGILVGDSVARAWRWWGAVGDGPGALVLAHVARFGFVGVLAGVWLARSEPAALRDSRGLDGAVGLVGWLVVNGRSAGAVVIGVGMLGAALSLHEIEAAVMVQPPGRGALAVRVLDLLHFSRTQELSAAATVVMGISIGFGLIGAAAMWIGMRERVGVNRTVKGLGR